MAKTEINLIILSPSSEINKLTFPSISTATTIGELREKITAAVATHPHPPRQRLIYRGHPLLDASRTLKDIFTQEIIDASETLSLHLVLPPEPTVRSATSSTTPLAGTLCQGPRSRPPQNSPGNAGTPGNPQSQGTGTEASLMQGFVGQVNSIPPHFTAETGQGQHVHAHAALPNGQFQPQLQQAFAQFQAVNQQLAAQLAHAATNPGVPGFGPNHVQAQAFQQTPFIQPSFQQIGVQHQQQQQPRTSDEQSAATIIPQQLNQVNQQGYPAAQATFQGIARSHTPGNSNMTGRITHELNRETWQPRAHNAPVGQATAHAPPFNSNVPRHAPQATQGHPSSQPSTPSLACMHLQSNLSAIETAMAGGNPVPEAVIDHAREMMREIPDLPQEGRSSMAIRLDGLANQANQLRETLNNHLSRAGQERVSARRMTQGTLSSSVYVLSSPNGPQALLVSPSGFYSSPWQSRSLGSIYPSSFVQHQSHHPPIQLQPPRIRNPTGAHQPLDPAVQAIQPPLQHGVVGQVQQAQQQQQQVNQARDLLRILLPLGGHLWLLVRLSGFVYFFTAGAGWRRTVLLGLLACLVFIAQTGYFRPIIQTIWDPIRRHAEGLVPLAGNERAAVGVPGVARNANATGAQVANREPTPQEAAERLLQERERHDVDFVRQTLRRVERAIALFVASLIPGVGERHIAVREAAEAARQAEVRERQEQIQREEEEARQRQVENPSEDAGTGENSDNKVSNAVRQEQAASPPAVEV